MSYRSMRTRLSKYQMKQRPQTPNTISEFETALSKYKQMQFIYKGSAISDDGYRVFIFTTTTLLDALRSSTEIYMDGIFSGIAILFALCEKRTAHVYRAIWKKIEQLCPDALKNVRNIMCDYERAGMSVAREKFPNSRLTGCWFHFNQAVYRRWKALKLTEPPRKVLGLTMALPLAPVDLFEQGLQIIQEEADELSSQYPKILQFTTYLRRTWLPLKNKVSVFNMPIRTNNLVEGFHCTLLTKLGGVHPNIWKFLQHLKSLIDDQEINLGRLKKGYNIKRVRVHQDANRDKRIAEAQSLLTLKRYSLKEFLCLLSNVSYLAEEHYDVNSHDGNVLDVHNSDVDSNSYEIAPPIADGDLLTVHNTDNAKKTTSNNKLTSYNHKPRQNKELYSTTATAAFCSKQLEEDIYSIDEFSTDNIKVMSIHSLDEGLSENRSKQRDYIRKLKIGNITETSIIEKEEANETLWNITGSPSKTSIVSEEANETVWNITDTENVLFMVQDIVDEVVEIDENENIKDIPCLSPTSTATEISPKHAHGNCYICKNSISTHLLVPCGHLCVCDYCTKDINSKCPVCKTHYNQSIRVKHV